MGDTRKIWQDAKAKITQKDWETQLKFKDDFGPNLDTLEKLAAEVETQLKSVDEKLKKMESLAKLISTTKKSYETKIISAKSQFALWHSDHDALIKGLDTAVGLASRIVGARRNYLEGLGRYADIVSKTLTS